MSSSPIVSNEVRRPESSLDLGKGPTPPNSASKIDGGRPRRKSLQVLLPKLPSSESLSNSPGPGSPGVSNWTDSPKLEGTSSDKSIDPAIKLTRKESYKAQRKTYRKEKKRVAHELLYSLQDPAVVVLADWLKIRGTLKSWTKLWCVLKPGLLLIYKSPKTKSNHWVGTVLLSSCQVIERPSKKDGFCFKLFHPLEQSIWAPRGPEKETIGAVVQPLPTSYLIFRAPSQAAGKCWLDALELSLRCSALLVRSVSGGTGISDAAVLGQPRTEHETQWSEADYEKHFNEHGIYPLLNPSSPINFPQSSNSSTPSPTPFLQPFSCSGAEAKENNMLLVPSLDKNVYKRSKSYERRTEHDRIETKSENMPRKFIKLDQLEIPSKKNKRSRRNISKDREIFTPSPDEPYIRYKPIFKIQADSDDNSLNIRHNKFPTSTPLSNWESSVTDLDIEKTHKNKSEKTQFLFCGEIAKDLDADSQIDGALAGTLSGGDSDSDSDLVEIDNPEAEPPETPYVQNEEEEFGGAGEQVEELPEEHKSLIWFLVKQVRPGMDLSKVVLPTFILEPRSFLDKLSDSYYHADLLSKAVLEDDAFTRMKCVTQWYLSGLYKKPRGLKKPYNPILGETFRCYWQHPNGSRTFYLAEQVSHHPPVSAFYVTNRQDGFCISASILAKSKFYGNSTSAILEGTATLNLLPRGEIYTLTVPYAHCKGILMGTLTMELGGKVAIQCEKTGYRTEIEFKLRPFLGGSESTNTIQGRLRLGKETLATINGHWDGEINIKDSRTGEEQVFFNPTPETKAQRLKRFTVALQNQGEFESERLWQHVSAAIYRDDQVAATEEKTVLEEAQRARTKERKATCSEWVSAHFQQDLVTGQWHYKQADLRPWDPRNDVIQYEYDYIIQTKTVHQTPMIRTASIISVDPPSFKVPLLQAESRSSLAVLKSSRRALGTHSCPISGNSTPDPENNSDSSSEKKVENKRILDELDSIKNTLRTQTSRLTDIQRNVENINHARKGESMYVHIGSAVAIVLIMQAFLSWIFSKTL